VVAVVTDNGSDECAALNPKDHRSIQRQLPSRVLRIPCFSHGTNLAIGDWVKKVLTSHVPFLTAMEILIGELHTLPRNDRLHKAPLINKSRWFDLGAGVKYVKDSYQAILATTVLTRSTRDFLAHFGDFVQLSECFHIIEHFIKWSETRGSKLCDAFGQVQACSYELIQAAINGNLYAAQLGTKFLHRMYDTQDLGAMLLSYIVTEQGREWYLGLPTDGLDSQAQVWSQIAPSLAFFTDLLGADPKIIAGTLSEYIERGYPRKNETSLSFWMGVKAGTMDNDSYREPQSYFPLAVMAMILIRLPLSEAEVERVFSHMRQLFGDRARSMHMDLIEARLTIKLDRLMDADEIPQALSAFEEMPKDVIAQVQRYIVNRDDHLHWGDHVMEKRVARQYPDF
jgi:hypothetical protein